MLKVGDKVRVNVSTRDNFGILDVGDEGIITYIKDHGRTYIRDHGRDHGRTCRVHVPGKENTKNWIGIKDITKLNDMIDFKIKGTKLPTIPSGTAYRCSDWKGNNRRIVSDKTNLVSYGFQLYDGEIYILAEKPDYAGNIYYMFREADIMKLANQDNMTTSQKLTVPVTDVLKIHSIACNAWKEKIAAYLTRVDSKQNITFTQKEVDTMFGAATREQRPTLVEIFGEKVTIDFDKIKTGSKVKIKFSGKHVLGIDTFDLSKPVDVVFFKTPHGIEPHGVQFFKKSYYDSYVTFHQNGKFAVFSADTDIDYIVEVIEY